MGWVYGMCGVVEERGGFNARVHVRACLFACMRVCVRVCACVCVSMHFSVHVVYSVNAL